MYEVDPQLVAEINSISLSPEGVDELVVAALSNPRKLNSYVEKQRAITNRTRRLRDIFISTENLVLKNNPDLANDDFLHISTGKILSDGSHQTTRRMAFWLVDAKRGIYNWIEDSARPNFESDEPIQLGAYLQAELPGIETTALPIPYSLVQNERLMIDDSAKDFRDKDTLLHMPDPIVYLAVNGERFF